MLELFSLLPQTTIPCFRLGEELKFYMPWPEQPAIRFEGCVGRSEVILLGIPNGTHVWGVTILPFEELVSGVLIINEHVRIAFSTFEARDGPLS